MTKSVNVNIDQTKAYLEQLHTQDGIKSLKDYLKLGDGVEARVMVSRLKDKDLNGADFSAVNLCVSFSDIMLAEFTTAQDYKKAYTRVNLTGVTGLSKSELQTAQHYGADIGAELSESSGQSEENSLDDSDVSSGEQLLNNRYTHHVTDRRNKNKESCCLIS